LNQNQHAYRIGKSCQTAMYKFTKDVYEAIDKPNFKVGAIFIDLTKAFDSVNRKLLISKLMKNFKLEPDYVRIIKSYLENRVIKIKGDSKYYVNPTGIPQGSALGPLLFSLFINDICDDVEIEYILYADDLVVYTSDSNVMKIIEKLQHTISKIDNWCNVNFAKMNYSKTEYMIFHKQNDKSLKTSQENMVLKVGGQFLKRVFEFKYLGVRLDSTLSFKSQYKYVSNKTASKLGFMYGVKRYLSVNVMKCMMNAYVHSVANYCIEVWAVQTNVMLQSIQSKVDRFIINFFVPIITKKMKRLGKKLPAIVLARNKINVSELRKLCNFYTIQERRDLFLAKYIFKLYNETGNNELIAMGNREMPIFRQITHMSSTYENCILFRGIRMWNTLPRFIKIAELGFTKFVEIVKLEIEKNRISDYYYY